MLESVVPDTVYSFMGEALNMRLGTKGLSLAEVMNLAVDRGITLEELMAIVENDNWVYSDGKSMVCSSFVAALYKAGGLFGDNAELI